MKYFRLLALSLLLPFTAQAQVLYGGGTGTVSNATINGTAGTVETLPTITDTIPGVGSTNTFTSTNTFSGPVTTSGADVLSGTIQTSGIVFSSGLFQNPLTYTRFLSASLASVNAGVTVLNSVASRTVFPGNFMVMPLGTATTATSVVVECTDASTVLASFAIGALTNGLPVQALSSSVVNNRFVSAGQNLVTGCAAGQGVMISTLGTLAGTTSLLISLPYTVQ